MIEAAVKEEGLKEEEGGEEAGAEVVVYAWLPRSENTKAYRH